MQSDQLLKLLGRVSENSDMDQNPDVPLAFNPFLPPSDEENDDVDMLDLPLAIKPSLTSSSSSEDSSLCPIIPTSVMSPTKSDSDITMETPSEGSMPSGLEVKSLEVINKDFHTDDTASHPPSESSDTGNDEEYLQDLEQLIRRAPPSSVAPMPENDPPQVHGTSEYPLFSIYYSFLTAPCSSFYFKSNTNARGSQPILFPSSRAMG